MKEIEDVIKVIENAEKKHQEYHSPHEGYGIILEELAELFDEVRKRKHDWKKQYKEASHVACTAIRYMKMCRRNDKEL